MNGKLRRVSRLSHLILHLAWGCVQAIVIDFVSRLAPAPGHRLRRARVRRWLYRAAKILGVKVSIEGQPVTGAALFVANHISWLDILVLAHSCDGDFVAKAEVRSWPLVGWLASIAGTIFVIRGRSGSQVRAGQAMERRLRSGGRVVLFPEGTSSDGGVPAPFRRRFFQPAAAADVCIQPVALSYHVYGAPAGSRVAFIGEDDFARHCWRMLAIERIDVRLRFLTPEKACGRDLRELAAVCHQCVSAALDAETGRPGEGALAAVTGLSSSPSRLPG